MYALPLLFILFQMFPSCPVLTYRSVFPDLFCLPSYRLKHQYFLSLSQLSTFQLACIPLRFCTFFSVFFPRHPLSVPKLRSSARVAAA